MRIAALAFALGGCYWGSYERVEAPSSDVAAEDMSVFASATDFGAGTSQIHIELGGWDVGVADDGIDTFYFLDDTDQLRVGNHELAAVRDPHLRYFAELSTAELAPIELVRHGEVAAAIELPAPRPYSISVLGTAHHGEQLSVTWTPILPLDGGRVSASAGGPCLEPVTGKTASPGRATIDVRLEDGCDRATLAIAITHARAGIVTGFAPESSTQLVERRDATVSVSR